LERPENISWFRWNLPTMLSLMRFFTPINLFLMHLFVSSWGFSVKIIIHIILSVTDFLDGFLARRVGNTKGIGRLIDPIADRVHNISFIVYLVYTHAIEHWILLLVAVGEIFGPVLVSIVIYNDAKEKAKKIHTRRVREVYWEIRDEAIEAVQISFYGKIKSGILFVGTIMILCGSVWNSYYVDLLKNGVFLLAVCFEVPAIKEYLEQFEKWHEKFLSKK
jgi:phosphatidylglycerophosphate synthase